MLNKIKNIIGLNSNQNIKEYGTKLQITSLNNAAQTGTLNLNPQLGTALGSATLGVGQKTSSLEAFTFNLYTANGGIVLQINDYDLGNGFPKQKLYVISDNETDISKKIGDIIFLEIMKR